MHKDQAIAHIRSSPLAAHADALISALRPSVRLQRELVDLDSAAIGASRFGGAPDLPVDFVWPTWEVQRTRGILKKRVETWPSDLDLLLQLDLAELPATVPEACPRRGMLYVFYDIREQPWGFEAWHQPGARVFYVNVAKDELRRAAPPRAETMARPCLITPTEEWTVPESLDLIDDDEQHELYLEKIEQVLNEDEVVHRCFGYPQSIQGEEELWLGDREGTEILFQIDSDDSKTGPGWMWGDAGRLYFSIRRSDLASRAFDRTHMTLQCY